MAKLPCTGQHTTKFYKCSYCGIETPFRTNHWGNIYNTWCQCCRNIGTWQCLEDVPEGYALPPDWEDTVVPLEVKK